MVRYRIDVGREHGAQVKDIVGAIANEAGIESRFIGRIALYEESSTVELPAGMPKEVANLLKRTRVKGVPINLRPDTGRESAPREGGWKKPAGPGKFHGEGKRPFDGENRPRRNKAEKQG